ncbi:MAG: iron-containing alcohol dehydrogenase [Chthoniobacter sp.]|uniref:iron-containing alcohol dehydrogenase n=1 Tax=Chthoniobacter sp. TaxID=2510640 RepID=UPI0032A6795E
MASPSSSFENHLPRRVITGRGISQSLAAVCQANGWHRPFIVSDSGVASAGLLGPVALPLRAETFTEVPPEPPIDVVDTIAARLKTSGADVVIALGGGSVMDAAKVASLCAWHGKTAREFVGIGKAGGRGLPTVLIPTTAGTGSEATFVAILTDPATGNKVGVVDPCMLADIAIVDPALTDGLPAHITAAAGMDALVHAIEGFIAKVATPLARGLALEASRRIGQSLEVVCREPGNTDARDGMAIGSHLAGMTFANSSCCAVHALALPLGGRFHIPHGVITGCFAGEMMRHNAPVCADDFATLAVALGWGALDATAFASRLDAIAASIGLRTQLRQTSVLSDSIATMARDAVAIRRLMDPNPREVTETDAVRIYQSVLNCA